MYRHIFFDLDHTLWDFERNSNETLKDLFYHHQLEKWNEKCTLEVFLQTFHQVNTHLWELYSLGKLNQTELRQFRFQKIFQKMEIKEINLDFSNQFSKDYLAVMPDKAHLIPHTLEVLEYLKPKYELHIITNGFPEIQGRKLQGGGIAEYFDLLITSDKAGAKKPERQIFDYTIQTLNAKREECIMIGDDFLADVQGAKNAELDHIFYNPQSIDYQVDIHLQIQSLQELIEIL